MGLKFALRMSVKHIQVFSDSQLIVNQVNRAYETKDEVLKKYLEKVQSLISLFDDFSLTHVPREENQVADQLTKRGFPDFHQHQTFEKPSYECSEIQSSDQTPCWIDRIINYLKNVIHPSNQQEAKKLRLECAKYVLISDELYRRSYAKPHTKCLRPGEAQEVMKVIHQGEYGTHARGRSLVIRILRQGFFWPNIHKDAQTFVEKCPQCQYYADMQRQPVVCGGFVVWGLDILRPMSAAIWSYKWVLVAVDYFTK
ncbi:hypothetical protein AXF42_Ash003994 [Apostasia shenzhenica]|uniref:Uncharacterized protein n=1 Tax=Apostasia shenzhenica TaxID=1088818 RepID=A0A2I0AIJ8_9ASPA|nr:hypothetical protein AXF42_Ash003994 [Apostasia shenzhenica]